MINKIKSIKLKTILKFALWFIITWFAIEGVEHLLGIDEVEVTGAGLLMFVIIYGFKFHIWCCVAPFMVGMYKCKHKKCHHEHCEQPKEFVPSDELLGWFQQEFEIIFKYYEPNINYIGTGYHVKIRRPASGNKKNFNDYLLNQSSIFKYMELVTYWTDGNNVTFTTKFIKPGNTH